MKRVYSILIMCCLAVGCMAQTQQGYVKTLGRPNQKGAALNGVTVRVKGGHSAVLSKDDGTFSVQIQGESYSLQQVQKSGYELNEKGVIGRKYAYSAHIPLTVVMVSTQQLQTDKQRIEDNAYKTAEKNFKARMAQLEKQKAGNTITSEQYRQQIQDLQDKFEKYQSLIDGLASHYAHVDYDELDEKEQEINLCIENGDLERADQLLQQLGIQQRIANIENRLAAGESLMDEANKDMAAVLKQQEKDAEYLYQLYTISISRYDVPKAGYYIAIRADLDEDNPTWQLDAASFFFKQNQLAESKIYNDRALDELKKSVEADSLYNVFYYVDALNNDGILNRLSRHYDESEVSFNEAILHLGKLITDYQAYMEKSAMTWTNLAILYEDIGRYSDCEKANKMAIDIYRQINMLYPHRYEFGLAASLCNLASIYGKTKRLSEEMTSLKEAVDIFHQLSEDNPIEYEPYYVIALNSIGKCYMKKRNYSESEAFLQEAKSISQRLSQNNPMAYEPLSSSVTERLADLYYFTKRYAESESAYKSALSINRRLYSSNPILYGSYLLSTLSGLQLLYIDMNRVDECEILCNESLEILSKLPSSTISSDEEERGSTLSAIGLTCQKLGRYDEAISIQNEVLEIYRKLSVIDTSYQDNYFYSLGDLSELYSIVKDYKRGYYNNKELLPILQKRYQKDSDYWREYYASILGSQSFYSIFMGSYKESEQLAINGISTDSTQHWIISNLAAALLFQGEYAKAENIYRQYKNELKDGFLDDFRQFVEVGVIPEERKEDVEKIKVILNEP